MRKLIFTTALALVPLSVSYGQRGGGGHGGGGKGAKQTARQLVFSLDELSDKAKVIARRAASNGRYVRAQKFKKVARISQNLKFEVRFEVLSALRHGNKRKAKRKLLRLNPMFKRLKFALNKIYVKPPVIVYKAKKVKKLKQKLTKKLSIGGGLAKWICTAKPIRKHGPKATAVGFTYGIAKNKALNKCELTARACFIVDCDELDDIYDDYDDF